MKHPLMALATRLTNIILRSLQRNPETREEDTPRGLRIPAARCRGQPRLMFEYLSDSNFYDTPGAVA